MRLYEFQAKRILAENGIPVPRGQLITSSQALQDIKVPVILKAQILAGGRGKAGAVRKIADRAALMSAVNELLGSIVKNHPVQALLAEEPIGIKKEFYLAYLIDRQFNRPLLMASASGGVDIEEVAQKSPERIIKKHIHPFLGLQHYEIRSLAKTLEIGDVRTFGSIVGKLCDLFGRFDATLIEINPLAETAEGFMALDAKIILDDTAAYRHSQLFASLKNEQKPLDRSQKTKAETMAEKEGINYVPLDGNLGMIADGAGTGMLTLDMISDAGGRPANFCEMGGLSNADVMKRAISVVLTDDRVKVLVISLIGGLTRMDEMAEGIVAYLKTDGRTVPIYIRMCGTKSDVGIPMLHDAGLEVYEDLADTVRAAVKQVLKKIV